MDINAILTGGYIFTLTFGAVSALNILWKPLTSKQNLIASFVFALAFSFVPASLGNQILNRIKDAVAIAIGLNGSYQFLSGIAKKIGTA